jgi:hypothetical protein
MHMHLTEVQAKALRHLLALPLARVWMVHQLCPELVRVLLTKARSGDRWRCILRNSETLSSAYEHDATSNALQVHLLWGGPYIWTSTSALGMPTMAPLFSWS